MLALGLSGCGAFAMERILTGDPIIERRLADFREDTDGRDYRRMMRGGVGPAGALSPEDKLLVSLPQLERRLVDAINRARADAGLPALHAHPALQTAAHGHAVDMAGKVYLGHVGKDGSSPFDRIARAGYTDRRGAAQAVAAGNATPEGIVTSWMRTPPNKARILGAAWVDIGAGHGPRGSDGMDRWCVVFGAPTGH